MTIDTPEREQAAKIRKSFNEEVDAIQAQKNLPPKGRKLASPKPS
jgi:hypothetical protein